MYYNRNQNQVDIELQTSCAAFTPVLVYTLLGTMPHVSMGTFAVVSNTLSDFLKKWHSLTNNSCCSGEYLGVEASPPTGRGSRWHEGGRGGRGRSWLYKAGGGHCSHTLCGDNSGEVLFCSYIPKGPRSLKYTHLTFLRPGPFGILGDYGLGAESLSENISIFRPA